MASTKPMTHKSWIALKALRELGFNQLRLYAAYQLGLRTGWLRWRTQAALKWACAAPPGELAQDLLPEPDLPGLQALLSDAARGSLLRSCEEINAGQMRIFGGQAVPIIEEPSANLPDWSSVRQPDPQQDIKWLWEAARFGWVFSLVQQARLTGEARSAQAFITLSERFFEVNPPYRGPQWASAQEVAIRLMAVVFAGCSFNKLGLLSEQQHDQVARWIAIHAARIPSTLSYARAQNNNHLLAEAAGLFTAGLALPGHRHAQAWRSTGWAWLEKGLLAQIAADGAYIQNSANYHRLMLQLVLWASLLGGPQGYRWTEPVVQRIQAAVRWLAAITDPDSGCAPNLGPNDGAFLFPLTQCPFEDFRPVLQAAGRVFCNQNFFPPGAWDDYSAWLGTSPQAQPPAPLPAASRQPLILRHPRHDSWCYLRAARFSGRPGHADQLHLDLWWHGQNIALDPGTYRYSAPPPWDNALTHTAVHNTLTIDCQEQMQRAGWFLYLDWAQAEVLSCAPGAVAAWHNGYRSLGLKHQRSIKSTPWGWQVDDLVIEFAKPKGNTPVTACLHWQLPDWDWQIEPGQDAFGLRLGSPHGFLRLIVRSESAAAGSLKPFLLRAGETLFGEAQRQPTWGWYSPTYGAKIPALSVGLQVTGLPPFSLVTEWRLPA
jgi:hypothetical protein